MALKYKQYLASEHNWAKKLPTGWRYEFLGDFIKDTVDNRGRTVPTSDFGIPLIATNCISNSSLYLWYLKFLILWNFTNVEV